MPLLLGLLGNWRTWALAGYIGLAAWGAIQTQRIGTLKAEKQALHATFENFKIVVTTEGKLAQDKADKQAAADRQRKEKADESHKAAVALRDQRIASLRHDADSSGRYLLPTSAPGAADPSRACFDRGEFERASRGALAGLRRLTDEGDAAVTDLNSAKAWAVK